MRPRALLLIWVLLFVACGGSNETETSAAVGTADAALTTSTVSSTSEPPTTTTTIAEEQLAAARAVGDMAVGEELFFEPLDGITHSLSCSSCHTLDGQLARNPTFIGIGTIAGTRIEGMSAVEYLRQSIVEPAAFKPDGEWLSAAMPYTYPDLFSEEQINDLIAYMLTR